MITLARKEDCCGCHACETVCPTQCITMREDSEGFLYPETDVSKCIDCHLCEKVCPVINAPSRTGVNTPLAKDFLQEPAVFAAQCASDELRMASASGGIFTLLAERVIQNGGVVFGARWNEDFTEVFHDFTETVEGLARFRGSKYLQSRIGDAFRKCREFLKAGREVMFTGTPCQIAGLRRALRRDFPNLLAVDIACHSTPSPKAWKAFWTDLRQRENIENPTNVLFRKKVFDTKNKRWNCSMLSVETSSGTAFCKPLYSTPYGKGFGQGLFSRPSCHECPSKNRTSGSDITIGDFWGIEKYYPQLKSNEGLSVVICNTERGKTAFDAVKYGFGIIQKACYGQAIPVNGGLKNETRRHPKREVFFRAFNSTQNAWDRVSVMREFTKIPFSWRVRNFAVRCVSFVLRRTGTFNLAKKLLKQK